MREQVIIFRKISCNEKHNIFQRVLFGTSYCPKYKFYYPRTKNKMIATRNRKRHIERMPYKTKCPAFYIWEVDRFL